MGLMGKRGSAMPILGSVPIASRPCGNHRSVPPDPESPNRDSNQLAGTQAIGRLAAPVVAVPMADAQCGCHPVPEEMAVYTGDNYPGMMPPLCPAKSGRSIQAASRETRTRDILIIKESSGAGLRLPLSLTMHHSQEIASYFSRQETFAKVIRAESWPRLFAAPPILRNGQIDGLEKRPSARWPPRGPESRWAVQAFILSFRGTLASKGLNRSAWQTALSQRPDVILKTCWYPADC
ncbi:hypothetical protein EYF80_002289 [Liparis tanakae]|uniref:Uncharacterized protein n=1 Tax=Liparis tanakae TaxID=230148 RepID=A0A4Z2JEA5_9TELE|nr:hypothetical protein EYF80_002289 [Liparis tanakae]